MGAPGSPDGRSELARAGEARTRYGAYRSGFRRDDDIVSALNAATYGGAAALGLTPYGLTAGAPADLVVIPAGTPAEAVVTRPTRELVIKRGRVVARSGSLGLTHRGGHHHPRQAPVVDSRHRIRGVSA
jgi:cytosine/adenosine deaminase-related metal-dependent hydrolase